MLRRLLPHPTLTLLLTLVWVLLQQEWSAGTVAFGLILGLIIPVATARYWPDRPRLRRPLRIAEFVLIVLWDIFVANFVVARIIVFMPVSKMRPAWISVPLELNQPEAVAVLAGAITLTPGTLAAELSCCGRYMLVHCLHAPDPEAVRDQIKQRYERRVKEFFA